MKAKEKRQKIAKAREMLAAAQAIEAKFAELFSDNMPEDEAQAQFVADAWNAAHDMISALECAERQIEQDDMFDKIVANGEYENYRLVCQNID